MSTPRPSRRTTTRKAPRIRMGRGWDGVEPPWPPGYTPDPPTPSERAGGWRLSSVFRPRRSPPR